MALVKKTQRSFAGGVLDKDLTGRQDLNRYAQGCLELTNFKVRKQGNVIKRSGTDLVCDFSGILNGAEVQAAKLVPLVQERERGLYMLLTAGRAYLVSPDGMKMDDDSWSRAPTYAASPYSIAVPFADEDLRMIDWCQSGDTVFFAHRNYPPCKIVYSDGTLAYERLEFRQGLGTPPTISSVESSGEGWTGTGGTVHLEYVATAVKDGVETGPSVPVAVEYSSPWPTTGSYMITIDTSGLDPDSWDCFYIYKKVADVFGLVGTTSNQTAFVSISSDFSAGGTLYPENYTKFDKAVHLRENGNRFASTSTIKTYNYKKWTANFNWVFAVEEPLIPLADTEGTELESSSTSRSATAQKAASPSIEFSFRPAVASRIRIGIGGLDHYVENTNTKMVVRTYDRVEGSDLISARVRSSTLAGTENRWEGKYSTFTACPAKFFRATVEYRDDNEWTTSDPIDCPAMVDQTNPGEGWTAVSGSTNKWKKEYTSADAMWSYSDAASVLARMDAKAPAVGASVEFAIPSEIAGKQIRKITVYGYTDDEATTEAGLVVNGIACYQEGVYVNTFTDDNITPDLTITPPKTEDHFVNPGEYPGSVQLYQQRLVFASSAENPFTFWMSCTGDLYNFDVHEYVRASDAITASTAALEMPRINRMIVHRDLMLFADGGEWQVAPTSGNALAPSTIAAKLQSVIGCAPWLKPIALDTDIIFCDGSGETLMATRYNFASDGYESSNLSVLSQRLFRNNPIQAMAYVQFPESTIECVLADGTVASLVYMKEHDVCAWSKHVLGGGWKAVDVAANKAVVDGSSHCAFVATRQYAVEDGETPSMAREWAILGLRDIDPNDTSLEGNLRMDAVRIVTVERTGETAVPPTPGHGETVVKIGEVHELVEGVETVTADIYAVGCAFTSVLKTTSPEFTDKETAQMEVKNATESEVRVIDGSDFTVRQPEVPAARATLMRVPCPVDDGGAVFSVAPGDADCRLPLAGTNSLNGSIVLEHGGYLPLAVLSISTSYRVEFANHADGGGRDE